MKPAVAAVKQRRIPLIEATTATRLLLYFSSSGPSRSEATAIKLIYPG